MSYPRETLVAELRRRGITFLAPSDARSPQTLSDPDVIVAVLEQPDTRLHLALITLFIRQPHLAQAVSELVEAMPAALALELQTLYMAAVYLQRLWATRLAFYLGPLPTLPDLYASSLNLPPADERFGKSGLHALAEAWTARSAYPFNRLASLNKFMDLFFEQLKQESSSYEPTPAG